MCEKILGLCLSVHVAYCDKMSVTTIHYVALYSLDMIAIDPVSLVGQPLHIVKG